MIFRITKSHLIFLGDHGLPLLTQNTSFFFDFFDSQESHHDEHNSSNDAEYNDSNKLPLWERCYSIEENSYSFKTEVIVKVEVYNLSVY